VTSHFEFQFPWVLALLAFLPVYAFLRGRAGKLSALAFSSTEIARSSGAAAKSAPGNLMLFLRLMTLALCLVALAGPRFANDHTETQASGVDIMLVLDLSWSMESLDMGGVTQESTRFGIASSVLEDFINKRPNDRIGLIAFSGVPYLVSPLTLNHEWLIQNLRRLHIGIVRELGTAIGDAIAAGAKRLQMLKGSKSRIIILLTDGDNNTGEIDPVPAAEIASAIGAKIYTIGIGIEEPCKLPAFDIDTGKLRRNADGSINYTITLQPANYSVLGQMARIAHGRFFRAKNRSELQSIYNEIDRLEKTEVRLRRYTTFTPLFQWPLTGAFCMLALELILANTRFLRLP
jgi:Ca-activated chloride channel family protein